MTLLATRWCQELFGQGSQVGIRFVSRQKARALKYKYFKVKATPDVLSFPAPKQFQKAGYLGDLVICTQVLRAQAQEYGHSVEAELQVLVVHGLLHLVGYDHERGPKAAIQMKRKEQWALTKLSKWAKRQKSDARNKSKIKLASIKGLIARSQ